MRNATVFLPPASRARESIRALVRCDGGGSVIFNLFLLFIINLASSSIITGADQKHSSSKAEMCVRACVRGEASLTPNADTAVVRYRYHYPQQLVRRLLENQPSFRYLTTEITLLAPSTCSRQCKKQGAQTSCFHRQQPCTARPNTSRSTRSIQSDKVSSFLYELIKTKDLPMLGVLSRKQRATLRS